MISDYDDGYDNDYYNGLVSLIIMMMTVIRMIKANSKQYTQKTQVHRRAYFSMRSSPSSTCWRRLSSISASSCKITKFAKPSKT